MQRRKWQRRRNQHQHRASRLWSDLVDEEVADFLQQNDDASWPAVVARVTPRQTDDVQQRRQVLRYVLELDQLDLVELQLDGLQVQTDVLRLVQRCSITWCSHDTANDGIHLPFHIVPIIRLFPFLPVVFRSLYNCFCVFCFTLCAVFQLNHFLCNARV